jgi:hypothetical protein
MHAVAGKGWAWAWAWGCLSWANAARLKSLPVVGCAAQVLALLWTLLKQGPEVGWCVLLLCTLARQIRQPQRCPALMCNVRLPYPMCCSFCGSLPSPPVC